MLALHLFALPLPARAWGNLLLIEAPPQATALAVGPSVWTLPTYPGAHATRTMLWPGLDYYAPSGVFASTDLGLGWNLSRREDLQAGVRLWPQFGRQAAQAPTGIEAVGTRLQAEAFLNQLVLPALLLQSGLLAGAGRQRNGAQLELGASSGLPLGADLLGLGLAATYANRAYRQSYFGVSAPEALASGLAAYPVPAGWQDISLTVSGEHRFGPQWRLGAQLVVARLLGAAARSPLVHGRQQVGSTMTLWREF